eukprot:GHVO01049192.1.p1 GENE.GHVO01049192.1~~GHVO01049192.1.p1  ORF type:complete len:309 (+),score=15.19 GHVO01049192.1:563-1489(+)
MGSVWLSKSCPRVFGPWYSAFRIGEKKYMWSIKVNLSWFDVSKVGRNWNSDVARAAEQDCVHNSTMADCARIRRREAGVTTRTFYLSAGVREVYDEEFDVRFDAVFDVANDRRLGNWQNKGDLERHVFFVPSFPLDDPIVTEARQSCSVLSTVSEPGGCDTHSDSCFTSCTKNSLLIPEEHVSFSGLECNKIGTSLRMWGKPEMFEFCHLDAGDCMGNQLGSFVEWDINRIRSGLEPEYLITDSFPLKVSSKSSNQTTLSEANNDEYPFLSLGYETGDLHTTVLTFEMKANKISWLTTRSPGHLTFIE